MVKVIQRAMESVLASHKKNACLAARPGWEQFLCQVAMSSTFHEKVQFDVGRR